MDEPIHLALAPDRVGDDAASEQRVAGPHTGPATAAAPPSAVAAADRYQRRLGARLRSVRRAQGLRLLDVEERSNGRFKAVVVGSYERGDRAVATHKLAALADVYGVPVSQLLPDDDGPHAAPPGSMGVRLSVTALHAVVEDPDVASLQRLVHHIRVLRGDHHGHILTLRGDDLRTVAITLGLDVDDLAGWLDERGLLASR